MNKLDCLIERMILNWPTVCGSRWDALLVLYVQPGSGFEWINSENGAVIAPVYRMDEPEVARASFFVDIDRRANEPNASVDEIALLRLERQFLLDHLDLIVRKRRHVLHDPGTLPDDLSAQHSNVLTIPDGAETSFRDGALEVIDTILHVLTMAHDGPPRPSSVLTLVAPLAEARARILANQSAGDTP